MKKEMLINVLQPEECRIAILEDGVLEELYIERNSQQSYVNNIYKGRIVNIEPSIQAAFVDFGIGRNGFLHVSDVDPAYYRHLEGGRAEGGRDGGRGRGRDGGRGRGRDGGRGRDRDRGRSRSSGERYTPPPDFLDSDERPEDPWARLSDLPVSDPIPDDEFPADEPVEMEAQDVMEPPEIEAEPQITPALESAPPSSETVSHFGAGLFDDEPIDNVPSAASLEAMAQSVPAPGETEEPTLEPAPPSRPTRRPRTRKEPKTDPKSEAPSVEGGPTETDKPDDEEAKPRRRRTSSTPRRSRKTDAASEASPEEPTSDDKPRLMDSAERRTDEDDPGVTSPLEPPSESPRIETLFDREPYPAELAEESESIIESTTEEPREASPFLDSPDDLEDPDDNIGNRRDPLEDDDQFMDMDDDLEAGPPRRNGMRDRRGGPRRGFGRDGGRPKPLIQDIFKRGQEVLVQVIKEGIGTKGPTLSTYISIAGRYLVLMPSMSRIGISRKIEDEQQRRRLKDVMTELNPPKGLGIIVRTASVDRDKKELQNDMNYLLRLWQTVVKRIRKMKGPCEVYRDNDIITRTIRDTFTPDIDTVLVDAEDAYHHTREFVQSVMPKYADRIRHYADSEPLYHRYGIEEEIARIHNKRVELPHGGSIIIESTEALVAIDVNSGNFRADNNAEETAFQMNLLAAREIARQLRLRNLGGVIVNDFIDMKEERHRRAVENAMREAVKRDRARTKVLKISPFGLIEMTRQRFGPGLKKSIYEDCPHCRGTGHVKSVESMSLEVMRLIQLAAHRAGIRGVTVRSHPDVANYLLNRKRRDITHLEERGDLEVTIHGVPGSPPEHLEFICTDQHDTEVPLFRTEPPARPRGSRR